jgi:hypothetical protein
VRPTFWKVGELARRTDIPSARCQNVKGGQVAAVTNRRRAEDFYARITPVVVDLHRQGLSLRQIAAELDRRGVAPRLKRPGQRWSATQVRRVLARGGVTQVVAQASEAPAEFPDSFTSREIHAASGEQAPPQAEQGGAEAPRGDVPAAPSTQDRQAGLEERLL